MTIVVRTAERIEIVQTGLRTVVENRFGGRGVIPAFGSAIKIVVTGLAPATPTVLDTISLIEAESVKWLITLKNGSDVRGYREVSATSTAGAAQFSGAHAFRDVPFTVDVNVVSGAYELEITNDDSGPVDVSIIRIA